MIATIAETNQPGAWFCWAQFDSLFRDRLLDCFWQLAGSPGLRWGGYIEIG
jgi:hypothetical protein